MVPGCCVFPVFVWVADWTRTWRRDWKHGLKILTSPGRQFPAKFDGEDASGDDGEGSGEGGVVAVEAEVLEEPDEEATNEG